MQPSAKLKIEFSLAIPLGYGYFLPAGVWHRLDGMLNKLDKKAFLSNSTDECNKVAERFIKLDLEMF